MTSHGPSRYALAIGLTAALLAGCGGSQPPIGVPGAMLQSRVIATRAAHGKSWMLPEAKGQDLIYATGGCEGTCILSYPQGKLVGEISGYQGSGLSGDCSDGAGNVYISNNTEVVEFAHGGTTPIASFALPQGDANGCAIDPKSGNLAVVFDFTGIAVFSKGSSAPTVYSTLLDAQYCGYDNAGNLFVDGVTETRGIAYGLSELASGSSTFEMLTLDQKVGLPGQLQWDGQYLTYESASPSLFTISRLDISGSSATIVSQTKVKRVRNRLAQSWIYNGSIIAPYSNHGPRAWNIGIWQYPKGGDPTRRIIKFGEYDKKMFGFTGVTVSVAPSD